MPVGKLRYEASDGKVWNFRFTNEVIYDYEHMNHGVSIGTLISQGTLSMMTVVDLLALAVTGLPGATKKLEKKKKLVLKMLDQASEKLPWWQEQVFVKGLGVVMLDDEQLADVKEQIEENRGDDDDEDGEDTADAEDPSTTDGESDKSEQ